MNDILGYDCDGKEIYEFRILRAIWSNDIDINELEGADPRQYCALKASDGNSYAISVFDNWNKDLIRKRGNINLDDDIPTIIKPIEEMANYEVAECSEGEFYYEFDRGELKNKLNNLLKENNNKKRIKTNKKGS
jgi:hypothetical protein